MCLKVTRQASVPTGAYLYSRVPAGGVRIGKMIVYYLGFDTCPMSTDAKAAWDI
jgi:hypothetical protein